MVNRRISSIFPVWNDMNIHDLQLLESDSDNCPLLSSDGNNRIQVPGDQPKTQKKDGCLGKFKVRETIF